MALTQTKKADDPCEEKDCKGVNMTLTFFSSAPCHDPPTQIDELLCNINQGNGEPPFTLELGTGSLPVGISLVVVGQTVRIQGLYNEPIAGVTGAQKFRVNDANGCCVCGNFDWADNLDGGCPAPEFKRLVFGGTSLSCVGANFANLPE